MFTMDAKPTSGGSKGKRHATKLVLSAIVLISFGASAIDACIQNPRRSEPCPHQIYRMMKLRDSEPAKITCICLADFDKFLTPAKTDTEKALRKMELKRLAAELQLTEEQVANLAKR